MEEEEERKMKRVEHLKLTTFFVAVSKDRKHSKSRSDDDRDENKFGQKQVSKESRKHKTSEAQTAKKKRRKEKGTAIPKQTP